MLNLTSFKALQLSHVLVENKGKCDKSLVLVLPTRDN